MNINEIEKQNWCTKQSIKKIPSKYCSVALFEQECHINIERDNGNGLELIHICCSHQPYITQLSKSEFFSLTEIVYSEHEKTKGTVLQIKGILQNQGLTIRKKIPIVSDEEKKKRSERAKINLIKR